MATTLGLSSTTNAISFPAARRVSRRTPASVDPPGDRSLVDSLYFFLVREEIFIAKLPMALGQVGQAEATMAAAFVHAPRFPYLNFLRGSCVFNLVMDAMAGAQPLDPDRLAAVLGQALTYARVGASDPELGGARDLVKVIEGILESIASSRAEAKLINALIADFQKAMGLAGNGIGSLAQLNAVEGALQRVSRKATGLRRQVRSDQGIDVIGQIERAVLENCADLGSLRATIGDGEKVKGHVARFNAKTTELTSKGINSASQLESARSFFRSLRSDVQGTLPQVSDPRASQTLNQLLGEIAKILSQLQG